MFTVASLLNGISTSSDELIAFRALQGIGAALLTPAALSLLVTTFTEARERNLALGSGPPPLEAAERPACCSVAR